MFKKKFKIKISIGYTKYHVQYANYRIFPNWKDLPEYLEETKQMNTFCGHWDECLNIAITLDSYEKVQEWIQKQEDLEFLDLKDSNRKRKDLPDHVIHG